MRNEENEQKFKLNSKNTKIMILDDEEGIIDSLKVVLKREGFTVHGTTNIKECLHKLQTDKYDIFITDFLMEEMKGDEVIKKVLEFNVSIYIILLTGHKDLAPPLETIRTLKINGYCEKSDKFDTIIGTVYCGYNTKMQLIEIAKYRTIGEKLKNIRIERGWSQERVSKGLHIKRQTLSRYELGRIPKIDVLEDIAKFYNISLDELLK